ncbi:MAG: hypothetical protein JNK35_14150 [Phycisphaerae bacterium]|nr:hypothetical protein [Phycisphaerae bacterium]
MSSTTKAHGAGVHQLILYSRALHPELFPLKARKSLRSGDVEFEAWLMPAGHALRLQHKRGCVAELVIDREDGLPTSGALASFPCAGEREYQREFGGGEISYVTTVQTETLNEPLYRSTMKEMTAYAEETCALMHAWTLGGGGGPGGSGGRCLSVLEIQRYDGEIHAQSFHLIAEPGAGGGGGGGGGTVLRTQTLFEHR